MIRHATQLETITLVVPEHALDAYEAALASACGTVILAGLLSTQRRWVLHAHRQAGLVLESTLHEGRWATLVLRKR